MCALVKELTESKKQLSECQKEVKTMYSLFTKLIILMLAIRINVNCVKRTFDCKCSYCYIYYLQRRKPGGDHVFGRVCVCVCLSAANLA